MLTEPRPLALGSVRRELVPPDRISTPPWDNVFSAQMPSKPKKRRDAFPNPARPAAPPAARPVAPQKPPLEILPFLERHCRVLIAALILLGTIRIVATYTVFSHTFDEPAHLAC